MPQSQVDLEYISERRDVLLSVSHRVNMPLQISLPIERLVAFIAIAARNSDSCPMRSMIPTISASASLVTRTVGLLGIWKIPLTSLYIGQSVHFLQLFEVRAAGWPRESSGVF